MAKPEDELIKALIRETGQYSDVTVTSKNKRYYLHRCIICPRSDFFQAACNGKFKEAKTGEICLDDDDPLVVEKMVDYIYTQDYTVDDCLLCRSSTQDSEEQPTVNRDGQEEADCKGE
ncbi:hypothetical protein ACJ73_09065 [Blastomyces percursus]|uniref:BTB domain-containing protein n=1 Tax=Blastomyces percursus TaxID=1658174 RepID=A0A1J9PF04_9EURO|nr:hypothetical protein ACJ73_09065 [Blastomyces percursus]